MVGRYHSTNVITEWSSSFLTKAASQISIQQDVVHRGCCSYLHVPGYLQICRGWCLKTRSEGRLLRAVHPCFRSGCNQLKPEEQVGEPEERSEASFAFPTMEMSSADIGEKAKHFGIVWNNAHKELSILFDTYYAQNVAGFESQ